MQPGQPGWAVTGQDAQRHRDGAFRLAWLGNTSGLIVSTVVITALVAMLYNTLRRHRLQLALILHVGTEVPAVTRIHGGQTTLFGARSAWDRGPHRLFCCDPGGLDLLAQAAFVVAGLGPVA